MTIKFTLKGFFWFQKGVSVETTETLLDPPLMHIIHIYICIVMHIYTYYAYMYVRITYVYINHNSMILQQNL